MKKKQFLFDDEIFRDITHFFYKYHEFYFTENQVCLIDGRDYLTISILLKNLEKILKKEFYRKDTLNFDKLIREYIKDTANNYSLNAIPKYKKSFENHDYRRKVVHNVFSYLNEYLTDFYDAYELSFLYYDNELIDSNLVEFNNTLSHIATALSTNDKSILESNKKKAKVHLYRGALDAYKDIITKLNNKIDKETQQKLFTLRLLELNGVGVYEDKKKYILDKYKNIAWELMNKRDSDLAS